MPNEPKWEEYRGEITLPGERQANQASLFIDMEGQGLKIRFNEPVAGAREWEPTSIQARQRLKYNEVVFRTDGLPKETVELVWKVNADKHDGTLAGVVVARPNQLRVSGEKGFTLAKPA